MNYFRDSSLVVLGSAFGVVVVGMLAMWQFYVFATFKDQNGFLDTQSGTKHLWWALGMALVACLAAFFLFTTSARRDRDDEMHIT